MRVRGVFRLPPFLKTKSRVYLKNSWTFIPFVVHIRRIHFLHLIIVENSNIRLYLRGWKTGTDSFGGNWNQIDWILFEMIVFVGMRKISWYKVDTVTLIQESLCQTEYFFFICGLISSWESAHKIKYVHDLVI